MYLAKKKKGDKWVPHYNLSEVDAMALDVNFKPKDVGDVTAWAIITDVMLEEGQFFQFGDILIYGRVK